MDARTRVGPESILSYHSGLWIKASNVVVDGFTIRDSDNPALLGYGIPIFPGDNILPQVNGAQIINNIFTNNIVGLGLSNQGSTQALVQHNLFIANNLPGPGFGTGIYTDEFVGKTTTNVFINENTFEDNDNAGIGFSVNDSSMRTTNMTITNNLINNCGRGIYLLNTQTFTITNNTISNLTAPTDLGNSSAINIFDGVSDTDILRNNLLTGPRYGIRIENIIAGPSASNVLIHQNNITGFATAGMRVFNAPQDPTDYATCNWWGSDTGPTNPTLNPDGTGDIVDGDDLTSADAFNPWLLDLAPDGSCGQSFVSMTKSFDPEKINALETTTLVISLINGGNVIANITDPLVDNLPSGMEVFGDAFTTCGGSLTAVLGSQVITLTGGSIPANGSCTISVEVKIRSSGSYINTLPEGSLPIAEAMTRQLAPLFSWIPKNATAVVEEIIVF